MNYLQVPAGIGEDQSFDFNIALFTETFKLNILKATYGLQSLVQEGLITYDEVYFKPSTLVFTVSKNDLNEFEILHPSLEPLIKGLLRNYEGIFDYPASIYESLLAKFIQTPLNIIKEQLIMLNQYGIVQYQPQNDKPQITLLKNRMYADSFSINIHDHLQRKLNYKKRIDAMVNYVTALKSCRSSLINDYFNDQKIKACGICDNCINNNSDKIPEEDFRLISEKIISLLKTRSVSVKILEDNFSHNKRYHLWKVLNFLMAENLVGTDVEGNFNLIIRK